MIERKYILTRYMDGILSFTLDTKSNRLTSITFSEDCVQEDGINIGDIFIAKVKNVVKNINAAFIEYADKKTGYLSLENTYEPIITNRTYDGRVVAGDEIIVQLEKEAVRTKEPVFTTNLSLAGKYCVITSGKLEKGVSKKCTKSEKERLLALIPDNIKYGVVVRTNAASLLDSEGGILKEECANLCALMDKLLHEKIHRTCYSRIYKVPPLYFTALRDDGSLMHNSGECQIITDDAQLYDELKEFVSLNMPENLPYTVLYDDSSYPLQKLYSVETKLKELTSPTVWLKSGAYLVIEKTEAMYVIDVNSGKNIVKRENQEYIYNINCEAAEEIIRQMRLRNLSGIIMVDFINMGKEHQEKLLQKLKMLASKEHILTTIVDITPLGIVEITRKKTTKSLSEQLKIQKVKMFDIKA